MPCLWGEAQSTKRGGSENSERLLLLVRTLQCSIAVILRFLRLVAATALSAAYEPKDDEQDTSKNADNIDRRNATRAAFFNTVDDQTNNSNSVAQKNQKLQQVNGLFNFRHHTIHYLGMAEALGT